MGHKLAKQQEVKKGMPAETKKRLTWIGTFLFMALIVGAAVWIIVDGTRTRFNRNISAYADIHVLDYGTITVALDGVNAPNTVQNFILLAQQGFYDGLTFHRIMEGFMMQGGDPEGNGSGGPGWTVVGEFSANGYTNNLTHLRGTVSMARSSSSYNSGGSQFFIMQKDNHSLDGYYAAFGWVTKGMDIVDKICRDAKPTDDNGTIPEDQQPVIGSIKIRLVK